MFPSSREPSGHSPSLSQEVNLEDRLRGLILNNAAPGQMPEPQHQPANKLPPHMQSATPEEQQAYLARPVANAQPEPLSMGQQQPPQAGRKRLNQSQRRKKNSQLSIPIDARTNQNIPPARGYSNTQQWSPQRYGEDSNPQFNPRFSQNSPQFQQPASAYSGNATYHQGPQQSPKYQYSQGNQPFHPRQGQEFSQHPQQAGNFNNTGSSYGRPQPQNRQLYQPGANNNNGQIRPFIRHEPDDLSAQVSHLEWLVQQSVPNVAIDAKEESEKEAFRAIVETACREAITQYEQQELNNVTFDSLSVELRCFGSMSSGFATKASDMDLALLTPHSIPAVDTPESRIPRILEKKLLNAGYGARLLTRTRVPIIKLCEKPPEKLRADLLEERAKWDNGSNADDEEERDGNPQAGDTSNETNVDESASSPVPSSAEPIFHKKQVRPEDLLAQLKQQHNQSIADYFNSAKKILRRLGGFDLSASSPEPNSEQGQTLNSVTRAFISGLASKELSKRLRAYASVSPLFDNPEKFIQRSLHGIWTQTEGERLTLAFLDRPLKEGNERREAECLALLDSWRELSNKSGAYIENMHYNRQLHVAYEKLKSMSSLGLVILGQIPHEQPISYALRAERMLNDLKGQQKEPASDTATPITIARYVSGITNADIREPMQKFIEHQPTWKMVIVQHRVLQLASDYENALAKSLYTEESKPAIKEYVAWIRDRAINPSNPGLDSTLLAKVRSLADPTSISLNKPRDRYSDHLEFPKKDIGIQCDINFSAHLGLHNTLLLRCYSHSDPRVRLLILFVKHWAQVRGINTPYRGSLSSYGYVLMVLHYLVNVANPFVCPNLQLVQNQPPSYLPPAEIETCKGRDVRFWRNEQEIKSLSERGQLNQNHDSIGHLLRGFFEFYAQNNQMSTVNCRGFDWGREVLSLRTQGGILTKQEKGWTGAKTVIETTTIAAPPTRSTPAMKVETEDSTSGGAVSLSGEAVMEPKTPKLPVKTMEETKEVRHRYLFAIEDPFELDHNVARTVTHNGIVSIRDEFRRAWRIIRSVGRGNSTDGLLDPISTGNGAKSEVDELMDLLHGPGSQILSNTTAAK